MGLDMYLDKEKFYGSYINKEERPLIDGFNSCENLTIKGQIGYWRKANAIHGWFVENVQGGEDNSDSFYVSKDELLNLESLIKKTLSNKESAEDNLPTREGFFFGSQLYDNSYFNDLKETLEIIKKALEAIEQGFDIYYSSSW